MLSFAQYVDPRCRCHPSHLARGCILQKYSAAISAYRDPAAYCTVGGNGMLAEVHCRDELHYIVLVSGFRCMLRASDRGACLDSEYRHRHGHYAWTSRTSPKSARYRCSYGTANACASYARRERNIRTEQVRLLAMDHAFNAVPGWRRALRHGAEVRRIRRSEVAVPVCRTERCLR